jgi:hypothetical protein
VLVCHEQGTSGSAVEGHAAVVKGLINVSDAQTDAIPECEDLAEGGPVGFFYRNFRVGLVISGAMYTKGLSSRGSW